MQTTTIRPGYLVSLKTSLRGNVSYRTRDLGTAAQDDGAIVAQWETERTIADPVEHEDAVKIRSKCRSLITSVCASSSAFGLLCPEADKAELEKAIEAAQELARSFNAGAKCTRLGVFAITGKVAADDVQAVRAINSEVRDILDRMEQGVRSLDVEVIRDAAKRAKAIGSMISPDASARLQQAIDRSRSAARAIVKAGETAAGEVDMRAVRAIVEGRTAFLDLDEGTEIATPTVTAAAIDMEPADEPTELRPDPTNPRVALEMDDTAPSNAATLFQPALDL